MKRNIIVVLLILIIQSVGFAQNIKYGLSFGTSLNILLLKSDTEFVDLIFTDSEKPDIAQFVWRNGGIYIGGHFQYLVNENFSFTTNCEYHRTHIDGGNFIFTDINNQMIGNFKSRIINNSIRFNQLALVTFDNHFQFGGGIYINSLIRSISLMPKEEVINSGDFYNRRSYKNTYYKPLTMGATLLIGYKYENLSWNLKLNQGLIDNIRGDNLVKEFDTSISIGVWYYLN